MELQSWRQSRRQPRGTLVISPPSLDTLTEWWRDIASFVTRLPYRKRLVLYVVFRGISVKIDISDAKAAGLLCVLGIGVGIGSLLIYRLLKKYHSSEKDSTTKKSDEECYLRLESCDSTLNEEMGHAHSSSFLDAHYNTNRGVSFFQHGSAVEEISETSEVRQRRIPLPETNVDKGDCSIPRMDIGAHNDILASSTPLSSGWDKASSDTTSQEIADDSSQSSCQPSMSSSLLGNYSPRSLCERNLAIDSDDMLDINEKASSAASKCDEKTIQFEQLNFGDLKSSSVLMTPPSEDDTPSSPSLASRGLTRQNAVESRCLHTAGTSRLDEDHLKGLSDQSNSAKSSTTSSRRGWSSSDEDRDSLSPNQHSYNSEQQFHQSILRRIRDFKTCSSDSSKSGTPTPERTPEHTFQRWSSVLERCDSMDSCLADILSTSEGEKDLDENFYSIEDKLKDIQDEMGDLMIALHDLKNKNYCSSEELASDDNEDMFQQQISMSKQAYRVYRRVKHRWERAQSLPPGSSKENSSCASIDSQLSWDMEGFDLETDEVKLTSLPTLWKFSTAAQKEAPVSSDKVLKEESLSSEESFEILGKVSCDVDSRELLKQCEQDKDSKSKPVQKVIISIGEREELEEYAMREWKGNTKNANIIRNAYIDLWENYQCRHLRRIRGDNYCAIRSCVVQMIIHGIPLSDRWSPQNALECLHQLYKEESSVLKAWTFAHRLPIQPDIYSTMKNCINILYTKIDEVSILSTLEKREKWIVEQLNTNSTMDIMIMEAVKLLMLMDAIELYKKQLKGEDVPVFAWLLFARETSTTPGEFVRNHLNNIGGTAGLEQVEMFLLGHALEVIIQVARLYQHGQQDFICLYPDEIQPNWSKVFLIAEDDRHYNIALTYSSNMVTT